MSPHLSTAPAPAPEAHTPRPLADWLPVPDEETASEPAPAARPLPALIVVLGLSVILGLFAARAWDVARRDSITSDETTHLVRTLHYWMTGDDLGMWELGAPRLPHALYGLASYTVLKTAGLLPTRPDEVSLTTLVVSGDSRVLGPARTLAIAWGLALIGLVYWGASRTQGRWVGLVAATLVALVPECLAHAAIAGSDMPFTVMALLSLILLARYHDQPRAGRWLAVATAIGLAWAMRHSAVVLLPIATLVHLSSSCRREPAQAGWLDRIATTVLATVVLGSVAFGILWAGDGLRLVRLSELAERVTTLSVPSQIGPFDLSWLPLPSSVLSLLKQVRHQAHGHEAYFLGGFGTSGWTRYFPIAFLIKTPIALLALMILAVARIRPRGAGDWIALACLAVLWFTLLRGHVNIGVRYALLTYPIAALFVARLFSQGHLRDRVVGPLAVLGLLGFAVSSAQAHPRYLSSFNELVGGPRQGWLYLADSNIDWGQDFQALVDALPELGIDEITYDLSTERRIQRPGLLAYRNPPRSMREPAEAPPNRRLHDAEGGWIPVPTRYVAVSVSRLLGLYSQNDMSWLRSRRLVRRIGDSIFVFDLDQPAERPIWE